MTKARSIKFTISALSSAVLLASLVPNGVSAQNNPLPRPNSPAQSNAQEQPNEVLRSADENSRNPDVSPIRRIERGQRPGESFRPINTQEQSIDGSNNNLSNVEMNEADTQLRRWLTPDYSDGVQALAGANRPSARAVSNSVNAQESSVPNAKNASDFLWQWGQFLDHDIDLTDGVDPAELANIAIPFGDAFFDPNNTGSAEMTLNRSLYDVNTSTDSTNPRQQINEITGWVDASNVYGSDDERAEALRASDGTGQLKVSTGNLLPFNEAGLANAGGDSATLFLAGDVRANEQVGLTAMHTLFVREHNRLAQVIAGEEPGLSGDEIYQRARRIVMSEIQAISYNEFLPLLLGPGALSPYRGYRPNADARIANVFSTGAYRFGHSLLSTQILRLDQQGNEVAEGHLPLRNAFFAPQRLVDEGGIEPILRGLANQVCQELDALVVDDVRNFLFGNPGQGGFDLAALNIQRGRDHGLPSYNEAREALGLDRLQSFAQVSSDPEMQQRLADAYVDVDSIDLWVGGLAEDSLGQAMVGELFFTILKLQFEALRDGDRFWYQRTLDLSWRRYVANSRLSDIIRRNTEIGDELPSNVFVVGALPTRTNDTNLNGPRRPGRN